jgi:Amt family ammonium transporter
VRRKLFVGAAAAGLVTLLTASPAAAQTEMSEGAQFVLDNLWVFIAGVLVFFMQAGFGLLEAGLTRAKNAANIMMKNLMDMSAGVLAFLLVGFSIGFGPGGEALGGWFGFDGFGVEGIDSSVGVWGGNGTLMTSTFFLFQVAFAATAATIVSGAMAERTKFRSYFIYSVAITAFIYPVILRWTWGGGWLTWTYGEEDGWGFLDVPFSDFAGSTVVHGTGGWAALMGAMILGPRIGKYASDGRPRAIPGHSIPLVVLGALILFIGWFGFNPGSELAADDFVMAVATKTLVAACAGAVVATVVIWITDRKPDVSMGANGLLAGLVAITAPCAAVETWAAVVIGAVAGLIVVFSVKMFDRLKIDDPVGAISVHGVCGTWGTFSIALFATIDDAFLQREDAGLFYGGGFDQMVTQVTYIVTHFIFVTVAAGLIFLAIKKTIGLRVSEEEELAGLDVEEHGSPGYHFELGGPAGPSGATAEAPAGATQPVMSGGR